MARHAQKRVPKSSGHKPGIGGSVKAGTRLERVASVKENAARGAVATRSDRRSVPATQAKNRFGEILQEARDSGPVFIERHGRAQAVVLGIETYNKLTANRALTPQERELDYWNREFDALHTRMQSSKARQAVDALFSATDAELNRRDS
jgi:prevent-host-death family protein